MAFSLSPVGAVNCHVSKLGLFNYRNWQACSFLPDPGLNLLLGANGQGKTNLIEALVSLSLSRSPRTIQESDVVGQHGQTAHARATVVSGGSSVELAMSITAKGSRSSKVVTMDGLRKLPADIPGHLPTVLFWPHDLDLIQGGPEVRRRLLDITLIQVLGGYATVLARYRRVLEQRNRLLHDVASGTQSPTTIDQWDEQLAELGQKIWEDRTLIAAELNLAACSAHLELFDSAQERLELRYQRSDRSLAELLQLNRGRDIALRHTSVGPHRDDLMVFVNGRPAARFASQGQQRCAAVAIRLGERILMERRLGMSPVMLLDDVMSELDPIRRTSLTKMVAGKGQVWITGAAEDVFPSNCLEMGGRRWKVVQGSIVDDQS